MIIIAYIVLAFTIIQLSVALLNLLSGTSLPKSGERSGELVSVLIPARNEEKNIGKLLKDLRDQEYNNIEIIVFDDLSDDRTAEIVNESSASDKRIRLIRSEGLPEGWLGKNYACHTLAKHASGRFMLFLDADVSIGNNTIGKAVSFAEKHRLSLISIFPKQEIVSTGEKITVPNMNYILLSLLPLIFVRISGFQSLSAANGQFMFFRSEDYFREEPHLLTKNDKVEDISISRLMKKKNMRIACLTGDEAISCRMYTGLSGALEGFSKNVIAFFGNSFFLATMFWLITTFGFLAVIFSLPPVLIGAYFACYLLTRIFISISSRQNIILNLLFIVPLQATMGLFIYRAFINKRFRKFQWKGRRIE